MVLEASPQPGRRAHDCMVNVHYGDDEEAPPWASVLTEYYQRDPSILGPWEMGAVLDEMDQHGVERAILNANINRRGSAFKFVEARPDRFALTVGWFDLLRPMPTLRDLTSFVADYPVASANIGPSLWGDGMYGPDNAVYYPLYVKCCELGLPLCMNAGVPGPSYAGEAQNPILYDRVCVRFPELELCMIHGADPWWDTAVRLLVKHPNLYLMTSSCAPKRLPASILHLMRTRGQKKLIFGSNAPILTITRTVGEARHLALPAEVIDDYLYGNGQRLFFDRLDARNPPITATNSAP